MIHASSLLADQLDGIATHDILQGLARLHSLVVVTDLEGRILWISEELGQICGGERPFVGQDIRCLFSRVSNARLLARISEQIARSQMHLRNHDSLRDVRLDLGRVDGVSRRIEVSAFRVLRQESGQMLVVSIVHPAEHDGRHDRVLRGEIDALEAILDSSPDAVMAIDRFGFISYVNHAVETVLGVEPAKLLKQPLALFLPRSASFVQLMSDVSATGRTDDREIELRRPDGSRIWISVSARTSRLSDGRTRLSVVYIRDVDARVRHRLALERKNADLESYVSSVSHDLRSPLVSLLGFSRLLRQDYGHVLDDTGRHFTDRIEQAGRTMESLIHDLLELSRIEMTSDRRGLVDPRAVLLQIQAELKLRLDEHGATLEIPADPPLVHCDRTRLYQLFSNLVGNALQHMGPCADRRISVTIATQDDHHVISVMDRGRGISCEDRERIFELFLSRGRARNGARSTGMGLAIVKKIAEGYGGRVWVDSEPDRGACFHVSLPHR